MSSINEINNILSSIQMDRKDKAKLVKHLNNVRESVFIDIWSADYEQLNNLLNKYYNGEIDVLLYPECPIKLNDWFDDSGVHYIQACFKDGWYLDTCYLMMFCSNGDVDVNQYNNYNTIDHYIEIFESESIYRYNTTESVKSLCKYFDISSFSEFDHNIYYWLDNKQYVTKANVELDPNNNTALLYISDNNFKYLSIIIDCATGDGFVYEVIPKSENDNGNEEGNNISYLKLESSVRYHDRTKQALLNIIKNGGIVQIKFDTTSIDTVIEITNYTFDNGKIYLYTLNGKYEFQERFTDEYWITQVTE